MALSFCWWLPLLFKSSSVCLGPTCLFLLSFFFLRRQTHKILLWFISKSVLPMFSSRSFMVSRVILRSFLWSLLCVCGVREYSAVQCLVPQLLPTLCDPMDCMQHTRLPCLSTTPRAYSNSCPSSLWCHPTISSSVISSSSSLQSFLASRSFLMSQLFTSGSQRTGASASVPPMNIQGQFPLGLIALISLLSKGLLKVFSSTTIRKHQIFGFQPIYGPTLISIHDYWKNTTT